MANSVQFPHFPGVYRALAETQMKHVLTSNFVNNAFESILWVKFNDKDYRATMTSREEVMQKSIHNLSGRLEGKTSGSEREPEVKGYLARILREHKGLYFVAKKDESGLIEVSIAHMSRAGRLLNEDDFKVVEVATSTFSESYKLLNDINISDIALTHMGRGYAFAEVSAALQRRFPKTMW
jgi:hypothetical protein